LKNKQQGIDSKMRGSGDDNSWTMGHSVQHVVNAKRGNSDCVGTAKLNCVGFLALVSTDDDILVSQARKKN
jgi:hypothetical protein